MNLSDPILQHRPRLSVVLARWGVFFLFWLALVVRPIPDGVGPSAAFLHFVPDLLAGLGGAAAATWISLWLLPPQPVRLSLTGLLRLAWHFVRNSVLAGVDVARRALDPRLPLKPGFIEYVVRLPAGPLRNSFTAMTSLLPGTLPVQAKADGTVVYHCLDLSQPVVRQLGLDESVLTGALRPQIAASKPGNEVRDE